MSKVLKIVESEIQRRLQNLERFANEDLCKFLESEGGEDYLIIVRAKDILMSAKNKSCEELELLSQLEREIIDLVSNSYFFNFDNSYQSEARALKYLLLEIEGTMADLSHLPNESEEKK